MNPSKLSIAKLLALVVVPFLASTALCDESETERFYAGLGLGIAQISADVTLIDDSSRAYKGFFGYAFNENVSVQGMFISLGDFEAVNPFVVDAQRAVANGSGLNASIVFTLPASERLDLHAKPACCFRMRMATSTTSTPVAAICRSVWALDFGLHRRSALVSTMKCWPSVTPMRMWARSPSISGFEAVTTC